jgi:HNH endonuclease
VGGDVGWAGPVEPEACRRLACDGALTRVLVTRHPTDPRHRTDAHHPLTTEPPPPRTPGFAALGSGGEEDLTARLAAAVAVLPPTLGGAPTQPLEVGRTSRVVQAAQRTALAVHDGGCVFPGCERPLAWCEAHHLRHWLHGGPTDLANLALLCRAHHRAVHEGGWRLRRHPDGRLTAIPPPGRHRAAA